MVGDIEIELIAAQPCEGQTFRMNLFFTYKDFFFGLTGTEKKAVSLHNFSNLCTNTKNVMFT